MFWALNLARPKHRHLVDDGDLTRGAKKIQFVSFLLNLLVIMKKIIYFIMKTDVVIRDQVFLFIFLSTRPKRRKAFNIYTNITILCSKNIVRNLVGLTNVYS